MMQLAWWWCLVLLPVPWIVRLVTTAARRREPALNVPDINDFGTPTTSVTAPGQRNAWRQLALWSIWTLLLVALARPQWIGEPVSRPITGRDLMLAVDVSGSMGQEDLYLDGRLTNRLAAVKHVVGDFGQRRNGDRLGLILFGTNAYLHAPMTFDRETVKQMLDDVPLSVAGGKTAIGDAIGQAVKRLRDRPAKSRVLILLTDGENNVGEVTPLKAAELAAKENIVIYTIGVGTEKRMQVGPFGLPLGTLRLSPASDLDETTLKAIAATTNGRYFRARNTAELDEIYRQLDALEPVVQPEETYRPIREFYYWPLAGALLVSMSLAAGILFPIHWVPTGSNPT